MIFLSYILKVPIGFSCSELPGTVGQQSENIYLDCKIINALTILAQYTLRVNKKRNFLTFPLFILSSDLKGCT